jgi:two-component system, sensor histidine kinase
MNDFSNVTEQDRETKEEMLPIILLVEDDEITTDLTKYYLNKFYVVDSVSNSMDVIPKVKEKYYTVILMDINLGRGLDGIQLVHEIRDLPFYRNSQIIAFTAYAMQGDREKFLTAGCSDYISKPFTREQLLSVVGNAVEKAG